MVQQGHVDAAERYLGDLHEKNLTNVDFTIVCSTSPQRQEQWDKVDKLLDDARQIRRPGFLAADQYLAKRFGSDAGPHLKKLTKPGQVVSQRSRRLLRRPDCTLLAGQ